MKRTTANSMEIFVLHVVQHDDVRGHRAHHLRGVVEHVGTGQLAEFSDGAELVAMLQTAVIQKETEVWGEERT